jgi:hypothetical protein
VERDGADAPEGDDEPRRPREPLDYWDDSTRLAKQRQRDLLRDFAGGADRSLVTVDWGQLAEDLVVLAGLAIRGVCLLVTWPVRWAWRRKHT